MKKIALALTLLVTLSLSAAQAAITVPAFPKTGKSPEAFVPSGWKVLKKAEGDLNKDNQADTALILASTQEDSNSEDAFEAPRPLLLLFRQADGTYALSATHPDFVLCKMCGGVFGDPVEDLKIERGTILISHYGGSNERWGSKHRFRYQNGDWYLIGRTVMSHHNITGEHFEKDENLVTGDVVEETSDDKGKTSTKRYKMPKTALQKLSQATTS